MTFRNWKTTYLALIILLCTALPLVAEDYSCTYKTFGPANTKAETEGQSLNSHDMVVGQIFNFNNQTFRGFVRSSDGNIKSVHVPGDQYVFLNGINDNNFVVG